jgi:hypothetical protein
LVQTSALLRDLSVLKVYGYDFTVDLSVRLIISGIIQIPPNSFTSNHHLISIIAFDKDYSVERIVHSDLDLSDPFHDLPESPNDRRQRFQDVR